MNTNMKMTKKRNMDHSNSKNKNESFDKIAESLDTDFDGEVVNEVKDLMETKKKLLSTDLNNLSLADSEYMKTEIVHTLATLETVIDKLTQDIKHGSPPRMFEVLGTLINSKITAIKELRDLNKTISDIDYRDKRKPEQGAGTGPKNLTINITSSDLQNMVKEASELNSMKEVDAHFEISDKDAK